MQGKKEVYMDISARHVHLTREDVDTLFGKGYELTPKQELHGTKGIAFSSVEQVTLVGPKGKIERVRILTPLRKRTQIEVSKTEARLLGINPPIRMSGDLEGASPIKIIGPKGEINVEEGVIIAKRHLHLGEEKAKEWGMTEIDNVWIRVDTTDRSLIFGDVEVRHMPGEFVYAHIDTDEANAAGMNGPMNGYIVDIGG